MPAPVHQEIMTSSQSLLLWRLLLLMVVGSLLVTLAGCSEETGSVSPSEAPQATGVAVVLAEEATDTPIATKTAPIPSATRFPTATETPALE